MKDRWDLEQAVAIIGTAIRAWDPYSLISEGAPSDEFDGEVARIAAMTDRFRTPEDIADTISAVFLASFGQEERFSPQDCVVPAVQIFQELGRANLLPAA